MQWTKRFYEEKKFFFKQGISETPRNKIQRRVFLLRISDAISDDFPKSKTLANLSGIFYCEMMAPIAKTTAAVMLRLCSRKWAF